MGRVRSAASANYFASNDWTCFRRASWSSAHICLQEDAWNHDFSTFHSPATKFSEKFRFPDAGSHKSPHIDNNSRLNSYHLRSRVELITKKAKPLIEIIHEGSVNRPRGSGYIRLLLPLINKAITQRYRVRTLAQSNLSRSEGDIIVSSRLAINKETYLYALRRALARSGARLVYDIDDDLIDLPNTHPEKVIYDGLKNIVIGQLEEADCVTVSTEFLKGKFKEFSSCISVVPNCLSEQLWFKNRRRRFGDFVSNKIRILYMGTLTHETDFQMIIEPLKQICAEYPDAVEVCLIGVQSPKKDESWYRRITVPSSHSSYPDFVSWITSNNDYSIGLAPLCDTEFNRAKSGLKFLDYSALALCSLCSDVESYNNLVVDSHNALLVKNDPLNWYQAIKLCIEDESMTSHLRFVSYREVREKHTVEANIGKWSALLDKLVS